MKRQHPHSHPCGDCSTPTECPDGFEFNYDGSPEAWCPSFHGRGWSPVCQDCGESRQQAIRDEARVENDR